MKMKDKPKFKIDKEYCREHNMTPKQYKNKIRQKLNYQSIDTWYDPTKSVKENLIFAEEHDLKNAKQRTLYNYCRARAINTKGTKPTEPQKPSPATPPEPQKPSTEPSEALERNEATQSAPEAKQEATRAHRTVKVKKANIIAFINYHTKQRTSKYYQNKTRQNYNII